MVKALKKLPEKYWVTSYILSEKKELINWLNKGVGSSSYKIHELEFDSGIHFPNFTTFEGFSERSHTGPKNEGYIKITYAQWKKWVLDVENAPVVKNKVIIGYKPPYDLFDRNIPSKVYIYKKDGLNDPTNYYYPYHIPSGLKEASLLFALPKEIVEKWEPVYQEECVIVLLEDKKIQIIIKKGQIMAEKTIIPIALVERIYQTINGGWKPSDSPWNIELIGKVKIGCTIVEKEELKKVIDEYKRLNES